MEKAIIGKKVGMSQIFDADGKVIPVTVIEAGPCVVVQKKTAEKDFRRELVRKLDEANVTVYPFEYRKKEEQDFKYFSDKLDSRDNVANSKAELFYRQHGVKRIEKAMEVESPSESKGKRRVVMTTRYCLRRELGCCKKAPENKKLFKLLSEPLTITTGPLRG